MKKVLFISYYFPPFGGGGVQRAVKFVKYLPKFGWEPIILTAKYRYRQIKDSSYWTDAPQKTKIYRAFNFEPTSFLPWRIKSALDEQFMIPDDKIWWFPFAVKLGIKTINTENIKLIFATGSPWTALLVGTKLKKFTNRPLVIDFRDPWTQNFNRSRNSSQQRYEKERKLERMVLENADYVITVTEPIRQSFVKLYPFVKDKIKVIPNGYDEDDFSTVKKKFDISSCNKFIITYIGSFYGRQSPKSFLLALKELMKELPELREKVKVRFIGNIVRPYRKLINKLGLEDLVSLEGYVEHLESLKYLLESDVLLLVIGKGKGDEGVMTGKLFEYLASGKPILALVPVNGVAAELARKSGVSSLVDPEDKEGIKKEVLKLYNMHKTKNLILSPNWNIIRGFERKILTNDLAGVFNRVVGQE